MAITKPFRKSMAIPFVLFLWGPSFTLAPHSSSNGAHDLAARLARMADQLAGDGMKEKNIAGLSVTIVVNQRVAVSRAYGMPDVENHVPVSMASQRTSAGQATGYGYGWEIKQQNGMQWVEHTGHQPGTSDVLLLLPGRDFAVAIMSNTDDIDVTPMAETLARAYLAAGTGQR